MYRAISLVFLTLALLASAGCGAKSKDELHAEGMKQLHGGNPGGAVVLFKSVLEKDQNFQEARFQLAKAYVELGKLEQAEKEFLKVQKQNPSRDGVLIELSKVHNATGKTDMAVSEIRDYLKRHGDSPEAHEILGMSYYLKGMPDESERSLREALRIEPGRTAARLQLAGLLMEMGKGREREARSLVDDVLQRDPKNAKAYNILAAYEVSLGNRDRALELYRTLASISPDDPTPQYRQGMLYVEKGDHGKADQIADTLIQKFSKRAEGHRLKGIVAHQRQNYADAITALQNSLKLSPSLEGYYYLGLSLYSRGELETALSQFRRILDHKPTFVRARILSSLILLKQKRIDDAIAEINRVLEADSRSAIAHNILGSAYMAQGKYDEGMKELTRATELDPKIIDAHLKKGIFRLSKGRVQEAETDFSTAVRVAPEVLNTRLVLAAHYMRQNRGDKALATLRDGLAGNKGDAPLYNTMAAVMFNEKKPAEGVRYLQKAKEADPEFLPAAFNLATYHAANGDQDRAMGEYQEIIRRSPRNLRALLGMAVLSELRGKESDALGWYLKAKETGETAAYLALASYHDKKGSHDKAIEILDEAVKVQPRNTEALVMKGRLLVAQKRGKEAIKTFNDLESISPDQGLPLKVAAYVQLKETAKALAEARRAVALKPNSASGYTIVASVLASQGDLSGAIREVRSGLRAEPDNVRAAMMLGDLLARGGDTAAAMEEYGKVLKNNPDHAPAHFAQGMLLETAGKKREAVARYRQALEKAENFVPALNNLAFLFADGHGPRQEALRLSLAALRQEPNNPAIIDTYGYALLKNGRGRDALKVLEKAAALLPNNPSVRYHLALAYQESGDRARATAALQQALQKGEFPEAGQARWLLAELSNGAASTKTGRN